jgi:ATP-dependent Clp protease ATP-binding subunit ClpC
MPGLVDKFTEDAQRVLTLAQDEAQRLDHNFIGTEHLLLGLVGVEGCVAARALKTLGAGPDEVRRGVESIEGQGEHPVIGEIGLTPRLKKILELAVDEARLRKDRHVGTEHLLLGLLREGTGIAADVLARLDVSPARVREEIRRVLSEKPPRS